MSKTTTKRTNSTPVSPPAASEVETPAAPFLERQDWSVFWTSFLVTFGVYFYTLAPTVTLEDSGELAVASDYLGVPHPPGYPIWTLITWFFQWIFHWVKYFGHPDSNIMIVWNSILNIFGAYDGPSYPNPAWSVGLCSAFCGALACGMQAILVRRSGMDMLRNLTRLNEVIGEKQEALICWIGGVAGGLLLAFSPVLWSQSTIVEVYALNAAFQVGCLLLLYRWMSRPHETATLCIMWFVFGLGLTNHQTLLFLGPALAIGILVRDFKLFSTFAFVGLFEIALVAANYAAKSAKNAEWMWVSGPTQPAFWIYTVLAVLVPCIALKLYRGRIVCIALWLAFLGFSFNGFMPFASEQNPPINWGYPRTWEGFIHALTRGQYEAINVADIFGEKFLLQIASYLKDLRGQFTLPIAALGCLPFCIWGFTRKGRRVNIINTALVLAIGSAALALLEAVLKLDNAIFSTIYRGASLLIIPIAFVGIMIIAVNFFEWLLAQSRSSDAIPMLIGKAILFAAGAGVLYADANWIYNLVKDPMMWTSRALILGFVLGPPIAVVAIILLRRSTLALSVELSEPMQRFLLMTVVAFLSLSVIFISFQNLASDIQSLFIGRVQFIQSHAVFALWIGFGAIFALAQLDLLFGGRRSFSYVGAALVGLLPMVLVYQNYYDEEQIRIVGGAEQNGHDFGWQFGDWQLRGAVAILEQISPEERAEYPNPDFPPSMGTNAIFFGGTDPGRFVPTYMIYCADVRPDVKLITQNALADNTYMAVMRDLYGDIIWIPSQQDSNFAFQKYVEDIQAGRIPAGAEVSFEGGRVSVQGVQGVMMINGILARMIFESNKAKHDFYVEESYVIPWMYPYLEPHGLIMKINAEPLPGLTPEMIKNDREFWDWYTKRLMGNEKFLRDVVARKTFSKLRGAIAGLYVARRHLAEAEYAFRQSIELYPLSPEANFRLADVYMQQFRFSDAKQLIEAFLQQDPANDKVSDFLNQIRNMEKADLRRRQLEAMLAQGGDINSALELVGIYRQMNLMAQFEGLAMNIINQQHLPPDVILQVAQLFADAKQFNQLGTALEIYLKREPSNPRIWIDLAAVYANTDRHTDCLRALRRAVELGGEPARDIARKDRRFDPVRENAEFKALVPPPKPGIDFPMNFKIPGMQ